MYSSIILVLIGSLLLQAIDGGKTILDKVGLHLIFLCDPLRRPANGGKPAPNPLLPILNN
jgi:hypothetical protein